MAVIYLKHPIHGVKVATSDFEAKTDISNGWTLAQLEELKASSQNENITLLDETTKKLLEAELQLELAEKKLKLAQEKEKDLVAEVEKLSKFLPKSKKNKNEAQEAQEAQEPDLLK